MTISGRVIDYNGAPIPMAIVHDFKNSTMTNDDGTFSFESDEITIYAEYVGFMQAQSSASSWIEFKLEDDPASNLSIVEIFGSPIENAKKKTA
jgi:hypothetical protein